MSREVNMIGMAIAKSLEERGQVGATHMGTSFDAWYPGYIDYAPNFKNVSVLDRDRTLQYATPREYTIADFPTVFATFVRRASIRVRGVLAGGGSGMPCRMHTASLAVLGVGHKDSLLFNRYMAGRDQIARGQKEPPFGYFIPQDQRDPVAAVELLRRLAFGGVSHS